MWFLRGKVLSCFFTFIHKDSMFLELFSGIFWVCTYTSHVLETAHQESLNSGKLMIRKSMMRKTHGEGWGDIQICNTRKQLLVTAMKE